MAQTLEQKIRKVIQHYYRDDLGIYRDDVNYRKSTEAFVADVAKAIRGEIIYANNLPSEPAKYCKAGYSDRRVGGVIKELRTKKGISIQQLAEKMKAHPDFLTDLENGRICASVDRYIAAYEALEPTRAEHKIFSRRFFKATVPHKELIRDVVELYYGRNLWSFHPEVSYEEAIAPFIYSLSELVADK